MKTATNAMPAALAALLAATCGGGGEKTVCISGDVIPFNTRDRLPGALVSVLEHPEMSMTTADDGHFEFCGLDVGEEITLVMDHGEYHPIQTGTITLGPDGAERVTFQAVTNNDFAGLAIMLGVSPDETGRCQMVTTVTRVGRSLYDEGAHGEAGATVTVEPEPVAQMGPVYFNEDVYPDPSATETSPDGGALYVNVEPGEYVWTAHKEGVEFTQIKMKCRAGYLVNASPPWGLQALE
jgi:hypothetical protein